MMTWTQITPTRWERPLTGMEVYTSFTGNASAAVYTGRQQYTVFSRLKVSLTIPDPESALRHAWKQARHSDPDIATTLDIENEKKIYEVPKDQPAVEQWADSTFIVSNASHAEAIYEAAQPIKQATLYYIPKTSELVLRAPHWQIDGLGMLIFWDKFLESLVRPKDVAFGDEITRLVPTMEEALGCPAMPTLEQTETANDMIMDYVAGLPAIGPVSGVGKVPAGGCRNIEHALSSEATKRIILQCKKTGLSVTSVVHAAFIRTLMKHADSHSVTSRYTSVAEFDVRRYLTGPGSKAAVANYYTALGFSTDLPKAFDELAEKLNAFYRTSIREHPEVLEMTGEYTRLIGELVKSPDYQKAPVPTDALVSSLGVVEKYMKAEYGDKEKGVVVEDFKMALDVVLGMCSMHVYTFGNRLRLVYSFNDGYEEPDMVRQYLTNIEEVMRAEFFHVGG